MTSTLKASPIASFTKLFQNQVMKLEEESNKIGSPLGAWVLLAIVSGVKPERYTVEERQELENILGQTIENSFELAVNLLETLPVDVQLAAASWIEARFSQIPKVAEWFAQLKETESVSSKIGLPTQDEANAWASEKTQGLISEFPADMNDEQLVMVLTTAIVTKIQWSVPFDEVSAPAQMSKWEQNEILLSQNHETFLFNQPEGLFACHAKISRSKEAFSNLRVISVVGPDNVSPSRMMEIADEVSYNYGVYSANTVSLFDLDMDNLPPYLSIVEKEKLVVYPNELEKISAYLPVWKAESKFDLNSLGFPTAGKAVSGEPLPVDAKQVAVASYDRFGFEAAAVSSMLIKGTSMPPQPSEQTIREAEVFFNHGYAVVASTLRSPRSQRNNQSDDPWESLPAFVAWVNS